MYLHVCVRVRVSGCACVYVRIYVRACVCVRAITICLFGRPSARDGRPDGSSITVSRRSVYTYRSRRSSLPEGLDSRRRPTAASDINPDDGDDRVRFPAPPDRRVSGVPAVVYARTHNIILFAREFKRLL